MVRNIILGFLLITYPMYANTMSIVAVTDPGCPVCQSWHEQVMPGYLSKSRVYSYPSLVVKDYSSRWDRVWIRDHLRPIQYLPTFFLVEGDKVLDEFSGYSSQDDFYERLDHSLKKAESAN